MPVPGLLLLAGLLAPAVPTPTAVGPPRLSRGVELVYRGEVVEASDRVDNRFRKTTDLEIRLLVLDAGPESADCAVMTLLRPKEDPAVSGAVVAVTGANPHRTPSPPAVRLELVRVDARGRCRLLRPPAGPPPIPLGSDTPTFAPPAAPVDGPPALELGMFVPLPPGPAAVGSTWDVAETNRPPVVWKAVADAVWNGGRCVEVAAAQQSDGWDRPAAAASGWRRTDTVLAATPDGFAAKVNRRTERREGVGVVGWVEVRYELLPPTRLLGTRYAEARREAEAAFCFAADAEPQQLPAKLARIERYLADNPTPTNYREAVDAARRRCVARQDGSVPTAVVPASATMAVDPPDAGKPAPDFLAPMLGQVGTFRLSSARGKPAVVVFFKPKSDSARATLIVAEALHKEFAGRAAVVALAIGPDTDAAEQLRKDMKLTVPVLDGAGVRASYVVDTYPRLFVVDPAGGIAWRFDGFGLEAGHLAKQAVERELASGGVQPRR